MTVKKGYILKVGMYENTNKLNKFEYATYENCDLLFFALLFSFCAIKHGVLVEQSDGEDEIKGSCYL